MGDVRDVESLAWNDYLAFFVIPSLPRNPAKRKNIINAPMARFSGLRFAQNDIRICPFLPSVGFHASVSPRSERRGRTECARWDLNVRYNF